MAKYYVFTDSVDWGDEFDVHFFDLFTETEYNNIKLLAKLYPNEDLDFCFGTNEDFEGGFGFNIHCKEATEYEYKVLKKFKIPGYSIKRRFCDWIEDNVDESTACSWWSKYHNMLSVPEEIFKNYFYSKENVSNESN